MSERVVVNPRHFADLLGTSYLPYGARLRGEFIWPRPDAPPVASGERIPTNLAIVGDVLIVSCQGFLEARNRGDGKSLWGIELANKAEFDVAAEGITTVDEAGDYRLIGLDGKLKKRIGLPFLPGPGFLECLRFKGDEVRYFYHGLPIPATNRGEVSIPAHFAYVRYQPETENLVWSFGANEIALGVRLSIDGSRFYAATANRLFAIPVAGSSETDVETHNFHDIKAFSLNHQGDLLVVDNTDKGLQLMDIGSDWQQHWALLLPAQGEMHQPPASAPDGTIYLRVGNTICQVTNGRLNWNYDLATAGGYALLTVLTDNTVLVSAGSLLLQIDSGGTAILEKRMSDTLTTRPIMDERGYVYVGGRSGIYCLK